ncbi:MAG TPA: arylamine N-acetyltransferase [Flavobacteriaceae bacterium]|nr:arylamine N-acetyltransferase [Flavobacteriaceae bacterium]
MDSHLKGYFERIKIKDQIDATAETLAALIEHHTGQIPFENLNPLLNIPVTLDLNSLWKKLIHDRRGGYCFEQNLTLMHVLKKLNFEVTPLAARVEASGERMNARTHMLLKVKTENQNFLADVGFGGTTPTVPLLLDNRNPQETPHNTYRILLEKGIYSLQVLKEDSWQLLYTFDLQKQHQVDFEMANWYTSTFPTSHFRHDLLVAIAKSTGRFNLKNNRLTHYHKNGATEQQILKSPDEIRAVLEEVFHLNLTNLPGLDVKLAGFLKE